MYLVHLLSSRDSPGRTSTVTLDNGVLLARTMLLDYEFVEVVSECRETDVC